MYKNLDNYIIYKGYKIGEIKNDLLNTVVYYMDVSELTVHEEVKEKIPKDRYEKMSRYRRIIDRQLLIGNEILFEYGMSIIKPDLNSEDIIRGVDAAGKPYLKNIEDLYFNMSHSGRYAVCGFSNYPLGVDVEEVEMLDLSIAEAYFTEQEYQDILARGTQEKMLHRFFDYWVLKESFMKSIGLGLSIQLNAFKFVKEDQELLRVEQKIDHNKYLSTQIDFQDNYKMAICAAVG